MKKMLFVLLLMLLAQFAVADTVTCPLSCAGTYDENSGAWTSSFDFGVTFSEITQVSIQWSGSMRNVIVSLPNPSREENWDTILRAALDLGTGSASTTTQAGASTYPIPESFDCESVFTDLTESKLVGLLDGTGEILIEYSPYAFIEGAGGIASHGEIFLNDATLIIEGTVVPEPICISMLLVGVTAQLRKNRKLVQ